MSSKRNDKRNDKTKSRLKRIMTYFNKPTEMYEFTDENLQLQRRKGVPGLTITGMTESKERYIESQKKLGKYKSDEDLGNLLQDVSDKLPQVKEVGFLQNFYNTLLKDTTNEESKEPEQEPVDRYEELDELISELGQQFPKPVSGEQKQEQEQEAAESVNSDIDTEGRMQALLQEFMTNDSDIDSDIDSNLDTDDILAQRTNIQTRGLSESVYENDSEESDEIAEESEPEEPLDIDILDNTTRQRFSDFGETTDDLTYDTETTDATEDSRIFSPNI